MSRKPGRLFGNLALLLGSVILVLAGTEGFLRLFPQYLPATARLRIHWLHGDKSVGQADSVIGFLFPKDYRSSVSTGDVHFTYATDEHGFRNPSPWPDSAGIVTIGDSETFGYGVPYDSSWTTLVDRALPTVHLVNLGLPGMAPKQYLRVYQRFGEALHPKLLLFGLFPGNDLEDEHEFNLWLRAGSPGNFATWKYSHGRSPSRLLSLTQHSYLLWFVAESWKSYRRRVRAVAPMTFPDGSKLVFAPWFQEQQAQYASPEDSSFKSVVSSIETTRRLAEANGTSFLVLVFPTKEDVYLPLLGDSIASPRPPLVEALRRRGIPYLDLTEAMQREAARHRRLFFEVDGHPNATGYRVIAGAVLQDIEQHSGHYGLPGPAAPTPQRTSP